MHSLFFFIDFNSLCISTDIRMNRWSLKNSAENFAILQIWLSWGLSFSEFTTDSRLKMYCTVVSSDRIHQVLNGGSFNSLLSTVHSITTILTANLKTDTQEDRF